MMMVTVTMKCINNLNSGSGRSWAPDERLNRSNERVSAPPLSLVSTVLMLLVVYIYSWSSNNVIMYSFIGWTWLYPEGVSFLRENEPGFRFLLNFVISPHYISCYLSNLYSYFWTSYLSFWNILTNCSFWLHYQLGEEVRSWIRD